MDKQQVDLGPVQQTLLIPLLGHAMESRKAGGLIKDAKAEAIVDALDYDFAKWKGGISLVGATLRTVMFDRAIERFASEAGTIVEIGCGLNTRFERLDDGERHWIEFDLPDSMALRRRFFEDKPRRRMLTANAADTNWMEEAPCRQAPGASSPKRCSSIWRKRRCAASFRNCARAFRAAWLSQILPAAGWSGARTGTMR